mmetsp:Transcript_80751/g.168457  ORF Transcript_80751/g.168457 Transcript_80751/m.168457 type:complete len:275 (-) Transcript_80751:66-890(-)
MLPCLCPLLAVWICPWPSSPLPQTPTRSFGPWPCPFWYPCPSQASSCSSCPPPRILTQIQTPQVSCFSWLPWPSMLFSCPHRSLIRTERLCLSSQPFPWWVFSFPPPRTQSQKTLPSPCLSWQPCPLQVFSPPRILLSPTPLSFSWLSCWQTFSSCPLNPSQTQTRQPFCPSWRPCPSQLSSCPLRTQTPKTPPWLYLWWPCPWKFSSSCPPLQIRILTPLASCPFWPWPSLSCPPLQIRSPTRQVPCPSCLWRPSKVSCLPQSLQTLTLVSSS